MVHLHTSHLTAQHLVERSGRDVGNVFCLHRCDRTRLGLAALRTITHHDHLVEGFGIASEFDAHFCTSSGHFYGLHAHVGHSNGALAFGNRQLELTIHVGNGSLVGAWHLHCGTYHGLAVFMRYYGTANFRLSHGHPHKQE